MRRNLPPVGPQDLVAAVLFFASVVTLLYLLGGAA